MGQARTVGFLRTSQVCRKGGKVATLSLALISASVISSPASAQLLRLLAPLPILARLSPITELVGIEIVAADAVAAESFSGPVMLGPGDDLGMSAGDEASLTAMDEPPRRTRAASSQQLVAAPDGVLAQGGDQMGLYPLQTVQPDFPDVRPQTVTDCRDEDGDGVCDRDDQCRRTPPGQPVMANGCYLSAGDSSRSGPPSAAPVARLEASAYFAAGSAELDAPGKKTIQLVAQSLSVQAGQVMLIGYADATGEGEANRQLSLRRAQAVRAVLLAAGLPERRIGSVQGRGVADPGAGPSLRGRRVEVWLRRPEN